MGDYEQVPNLVTIERLRRELNACRATIDALDSNPDQSKQVMLAIREAAGLLPGDGVSLVKRVAELRQLLARLVSEVRGLWPEGLNLDLLDEANAASKEKSNA